MRLLHTLTCKAAGDGSWQYQWAADGEGGGSGGEGGGLLDDKLFVVLDELQLSPQLQNQLRRLNHQRYLLSDRIQPVLHLAIRHRTSDSRPDDTRRIYRRTVRRTPHSYVDVHAHSWTHYARVMLNAS